MEVEDDPRSRYSDYSCVTPLEVLSNDIELIFRKWILRDTTTTHHWVEEPECSLFGTQIRIELYSNPSKSLDEDEDAPFSSRFVADRSGSSAIHLCEWFGLEQCAAIFLTRETSMLRGWSSSPHPSSGNKAKAESVLSALLLATTNCGIENLCMFGVVLADNSGSSRFGPYDVIQGYMYNSGKITTIECDQRNQVTARYRRLNGMVELFDARVKSMADAASLDVSKARVVARHTYMWEPSAWLRSQEWRLWPHSDVDQKNGLRSLQSMLGSIPSTQTCSIYDHTKDPLSSIQMSVYWSAFRCGTKMETPSHTTLRIQDATVRLKLDWIPKRDIASPLGSKCLFLTACLIHAMSLETDSGTAAFSLCDLRSKANLRATYDELGIAPETYLKVAGPLSRKVREACSLLMAPRAAPPADSDEVCSSEVSRIMSTQVQGYSERCLWDWIPHSAPIGRLVSVFAWHSGSLEVLTGSSSLAHWWTELVSQLRAHWDAGIVIPSTAQSSHLDHTAPSRLAKSGRPSHLQTYPVAAPDLNLAILSQKVQVIEWCIESGQAEESGQEDEGGDFADCDWTDAASLVDETETTSPNKQGEETRPDSVSQDVIRLSQDEDEGYASACDDDVLAPSVVDPVLQPLAPVTSDSDQAVQHMLLQMKPGDAAFAQVQKQLRQSSLMADVYAFKQANPKAKFEAFIDWYCLGSMEQGLESELQSAWESGGSAKVLFNRTSEAEKALHFLETLPMSTTVIQLLLGLIPTCSFSLTCSILDLLREGDLPILQIALTQVEDSACAAVSALKETYPVGSIPQAMLRTVDEFIACMSQAEVLLEKATSLLFRFPNCFEFVEGLLTLNKTPFLELNDDQKKVASDFFDKECRKSRSHQTPVSPPTQEVSPSGSQEATQVFEDPEDEITSSARPVEREYVLRVQNSVSGTSLRMGVLVNEVDTFPTTRAVRMTLSEQVRDICTQSGSGSS